MNRTVLTVAKEFQCHKFMVLIDNGPAAAAEAHNPKSEKSATRAPRFFLKPRNGALPSF
ncbi:hypothetical protein BDZ89DRAFT_1077089 [Hymenopellis radicata]|nr:hypothetical protein BDZ89DRAFT_1077089 [Hymenopellis radicata]